MRRGRLPVGDSESSAVGGGGGGDTGGGGGGGVDGGPGGCPGLPVIELSGGVVVELESGGIVRAVESARVGVADGTTVLPVSPAVPPGPSPG